MRERVNIRLPEDLVARVHERAEAERRRVTDMFELLIEAGLGSESSPVPVEFSAVRESMRGGSRVLSLEEPDASGDGVLPATVRERLAPDTSRCEKAYMHRPGVWCKACGGSF